MPTLFEHGCWKTFITGGDFTRLEEQCPRDLLYFAILGPSLSSGRQTRSKADKLFINFQLNISDLGSTAIKGQSKLSNYAEVKTLEFLYKGKPPIFLEVTAGTVKHQQSLAPIGFSSDDRGHGASTW
jgi:hypothetical protein